MKLTEVLLATGAAIAALGAIIHIAAVLAGPAWYRFFGAPAVIVQSAEQGTWLAPLSTLGIAAAMALCAAYALSALGHFPPLPLLTPVLWGIALVCMLRASVLLPIALRHPELLTTFNVVGSLIWGLAGICYLCGLPLASAGKEALP